MQPRAFVVMPFGVKSPAEFGQNETFSPHDLKIDFEAVYYTLLKPALEQAGYEVTRADSAKTAGDIRTDMFFELVTADLVVTDISILNANVYYELGVRHGVCPNGVFIVNGNLMTSRPFDIVPDRSFSYDTSLYLEPAKTNTGATAHVDAALRHEQCKSLAKKFTDATALDRETVGSPVYSHLPGLRPVNWDGIETSKARYFNALQSDWLDCVRNAQRTGHPGDILTLAMNAPTRFHETRILYEAAIALIDLCRYSAAERVLRDVIRLDPAHGEAQFELARVLSHLGETISAEHQLRKILNDNKDVPRAADLLGQVFRQLWYLSWKDEKPPSVRPEKACEGAQIAMTAIHSFSRAHRADPAAYFAGFNALMLGYVLKEIGVPIQHDTMPTINFPEVQRLVHYVATNQQQQALMDGNYIQQFWCTTTLAGIHLIEGEDKKALAAIREACAIPGATSFQLQTFRDRLKLLADLQVRGDLIQQALQTVDHAILKRNNQCTCQRVVLWAGYAFDHATHKQQRFSAAQVDQVASEIDRSLRAWGVNTNDLAICSGMTESDILFAETCLTLGARVRIMLREPITDETTQSLWPFADPDWRKRFHELLQPSDRKEIWIDTIHLGTPPSGSTAQEPLEFVRRRHRQWLLNTARMEAEPRTVVNRNVPPAVQTTTACEEATSSPPSPIVPGPRLYGLFLWDGTGRADDPTDIPFLIRQINDYADYQGEVTIIAAPPDLGDGVLPIKSKAASLTG
jgi:tetratricopeptide (TPR) repeat protein